MESRRYQKTKVLLNGIRNIAVQTYRHLRVPFIKKEHGDKSFIYLKNELDYCIHPYNSTYKNERCVEIPIFRDILEGYDLADVLEVGNVLNHYGTYWHDVLDKYEDHKAVNLKTDLLKFNPNCHYKLAMAISTLEHIGMNDGNEPSAFLKAIKKMQSLADEVIFSVPLRQNFFVDKCLFQNKLKGFKITYLAQKGFLDWQQTSFPFIEKGIVVAICRWKK